MKKGIIPKRVVISARKIERISKREMRMADVVIINGTVVKDRTGVTNRPATPSEIQEAKKK